MTRSKFRELKSTAGGRYEGFKIARKPSREVRRSGRAAEIGGAGVMQRVGAAGGPGPIGFQGPPRSLKISPVNIQDEPADPTQSEYTIFFLFVRNVKSDSKIIKPTVKFARNYFLTIDAQE